MRVYPISSILRWLFHGAFQQVLLWVPVLQPASEGSSPPDFWTDIYPRYVWGLTHDSRGRPNQQGITLWSIAARIAMRRAVDAVGDTARDAATAIVRGWLGYLSSRYPTFVAWVGSLDTKIGGWATSWLGSISEVIVKIYAMLPYGIRNGIQSWATLFDQVKSEVRQWALDRFTTTVQRAFQALAWINAFGVTLHNWYTQAHTWLDGFRSNPSAVVLGILGTTWSRVTQFDNLALTYYVNLWSNHAQTLADFLADPLGWLYDRIEDKLVREW